MILTNEQFAECLKLLTLTDQDFAESIADLQKRLEESERREAASQTYIRKLEPWTSECNRLQHQVVERDHQLAELRGHFYRLALAYHNGHTPFVSSDYVVFECCTNRQCELARKLAEPGRRGAGGTVSARDWDLRCECGHSLDSHTKAGTCIGITHRIGMPSTSCTCTQFRETRAQEDRK